MLSALFSGFAILSFVILILILLLRRVRQPYSIAYILAGILLGPQCLNVVTEAEAIKQLGELGIVLLMFFIGSEINLPDLTHNFRKPLAIAIVQLVMGFLCVAAIGRLLDWEMPLVILTSFIISLSSSAIITQYLARTGELNTQLGLMTFGVLLVQDILVVPMVLALNFMSVGHISAGELVKVCIGGALMLLFLRAASLKKLLKIPMKREIVADHDLQVFIGFAICFGMAWAAAWFGLSAAFGAFVAGIFIGQDKATRWLGKSLIPFRVFFLSFFFLAVGLQVNVKFFLGNAGTIVSLTLSVLLINSVLNALLFRFTGNGWRDSIYGGALLSQIGEFSFVLMTLATSLKLIGDYTYQITLAVITLTMLLSTIWIGIIQKMIYRLPIP